MYGATTFAAQSPAGQSFGPPGAGQQLEHLIRIKAAQFAASKSILSIAERFQLHFEPVSQAQIVM